MTEAALRLADVMYEIYRGYSDALGIPAPPKLVAAGQNILKTISLLAGVADNMLRELAENGRKRL